MPTIDHRLCDVALDHCDTTAFENFAQTFHGALVGSSFVPLGGMHDGGADGFEEMIYESTARAGTFLQASKTGNIEGKISGTIRRLKDFGREPKVVIFYFSQHISDVDSIEEIYTNKLDVTVRVRGKSYIVTHINHSVQTTQAFDSYLKPSVLFLMNIGSSGTARSYPFEARTLCAFLGQEVHRRRGNATLLSNITDSLILWALEGTDPENGIFLTKREILGKIENALPTARYFVRSNLDDRLSRLSSKHNTTGREISWHRKEGKFALRFEERQKLIEENLEEASLYSRVSDGFRQIIQSHTSKKEILDKLDDIVEAVHQCIERLFERQGVGISLYILDKNEDGLDAINLVDDLEEQSNKLDLSSAARDEAKHCVRKALARVIYAPTEDEREHLLRLCNTYFLMFVLKNDPKVVEYFNNMAQTLTMYIGSDIIVKALSEYYLPPGGKMATNALKIIQESGSTLVMSEAAFEEVFTHVRAAVLEFENYYAEIESLVTSEFVSGIDRILIRSYFYSKFGINSVGKRPTGWRSYIGQFCTYDGIRNGRSRDGLRNYLCERFDLQFEPKDTMRKSVNRDELGKLTDAIITERSWSQKKQAAIRAYNDALHALRIYSKRSSQNETIVPSPFGYKTWWLTHERAVQRAAARVFGSNRPLFIMRPEFLLNYISLAPSKKEVVDSYRSVFPTLLAVSLSKRVGPDVLHPVLTSIREAYSVDESRAKAMVSEFSDRLKTDQLRVYEVNFDEQSD